MAKVAVVISHPIQHFVPQYSSWAKLPEVELKVFFASQHGLKPYQDVNFAREIHWEDMQLDFPHEYLPGAETRALGPKIDSIDLEHRLNIYAPDIIIIYGYSQRLQRRALAWASACETPVCMISDSELRSKRNIFKRFIKRLSLPSLYNKVSLFLTVGDANEAYYRHYGVHDRYFIRCFFPIDIKLYNSVLHDAESARQRVRHHLGIPTHHKVVLNVGKLVPWKRQLDLIHFSNSLQGKRDDVTVILAGTGPDEKQLRRLCKKQGPGGVVFSGFVMPDKLVEYYCAADVYAHCSEHEPHSLAISEAIYCARPVVISDHCGSYGASDDVRHGLNGLVYRCGDIADLSQKLHTIFDNNNTCKKMSDASMNISRHNQNLAHGEGLEQVLAILQAEQLKA